MRNIVNPEMTTREKSRISARDYARRRRLGIKPSPCEICGEPADCHHIDYNDPDRVMWLCELHHMQTHSQFAKPAPLFWDLDIRTAVRRIEAARLALRGAQAPPGRGIPSPLNATIRGR